MCLLNLDLKAKDETEKDLLSKFMEAAKDESWMMKYSAKAEGDVFKHFRKQRNYLKSQVNYQFEHNKCISLIFLDSSEIF